MFIIKRISNLQCCKYSIATSMEIDKTAVIMPSIADKNQSSTKKCTTFCNCPEVITQKYRFATEEKFMEK